MDYNKIGNFISSERKAKKLTQAKLAEKLFISEKTISKWENGKSIPDTNILPKLCEIFEININELLNGERISSECYPLAAEHTLLALQKEKEEKDKMLLATEIVLAILSLAMFLSFTLIATFLPMENWLQVVLIVTGAVITLACTGIALKIEQRAGYYACKKCNHKYIPTFKQVFFSMHCGRTRYMKCPHCKQNSWNKKVIK